MRTQEAVRSFAQIVIPCPDCGGPLNEQVTIRDDNGNAVGMHAVVTCEKVIHTGHGVPTPQA
jgi:hypothetical protein